MNENLDEPVDCSRSGTVTTRTDPSVSLIGHPYTPIGMGEHIRCTFRSLRSVAWTPHLLDVYGLTAPDDLHRSEMVPYASAQRSDVNIFHINGDEVDQVLAHVGEGFSDRFSIVYPLWELSRYPTEWARLLERFDEIWAPSRFVRESIAAEVRTPVVHMPLASEVLLSSFHGRRYFGIPESAYTFLFFFDLRSYTSRKNPKAVVDAFVDAVAQRPAADVCLVIKVNGHDGSGDAHRAFRESLGVLGDHVIVIEQNMSDNEVKNLVRCCDCFVSLHRSEGFGFGVAQAMCLGKPVIATHYSGNADFMADDACLPVSYRLVPVQEGEYPHWRDQVWADPSIDEATDHMLELIDDPGMGREVGRRAGLHMRTRFGFRATGKRIARRLREIAC